MHALVVDSGRVACGEWPRPALADPQGVRIRVAVAGICRTDLHVADGVVPHREPLILGHEVAGVVADVGRAVTRVAVGDRVTVDPRVGVGRVLGIHEHGAFADELVVPAPCVHRVPAGVSAEAAAMVEPIAACTAVLESGIAPAAGGIVIGAGRIATLTRRVLRDAGYELAQRLEEAAAGTIGFAVVTSTAGGGLARAVRMCRPEGLIVLKSREPEPASLDVGLAVRKRLTLRAVDYGRFESAVELAASGRVRLDDLLGPSYDLVDADAAFADARADESVKRFFRISDVWAG